MTKKRDWASGSIVPAPTRESGLREALTCLCEIWTAEKDSNRTVRAKWYEMALLRCALEVRAALAAAGKPHES